MLPFRASVTRVDRRPVGGRRRTTARTVSGTAPADPILSENSIPVIMIRKIALSLLAIVFIVEEWLWDHLASVGQWLARVLHLQRLERWLARVSPVMGLVALAVPLLVVAPVNLLSLFLLAEGRILPGIVVQVAAKLLATLLVSRVFRLVRPVLLTLPWFAEFYHRIMAVLGWAHRLIHQTTIYRWSVAVKSNARLILGTLLRHGGGVE